MRILDRPGRISGCTLIVIMLSLATIKAQDLTEELTIFLDKATEEIPAYTSTPPAKQTPPDNQQSKSYLQNITEEVKDQPKARFVHSKRKSDENLKIQLGYFKEKKNVNKMVNKISKYDWSVHVNKENNNGTDYYRVMIVDISSRKAADEILVQLKADGFKAVLK